jgi:hypothetical protein
MTTNALADSYATGVAANAAQAEAAQEAAGHLNAAAEAHDFVQQDPAVAEEHVQQQQQGEEQQQQQQHEQDIDFEDLWQVQVPPEEDPVLLQLLLDNDEAYCLEQELGGGLPMPWELQQQDPDWNDNLWQQDDLDQFLDDELQLLL